MSKTQALQAPEPKEEPRYRYSSVTAFLLNPEAQTVQSVMMYPMTRIELNEIHNGVILARVFVVDDAGRWVEVQ